MSSLKGEGSGVIETEEVSMLASVSMGEEEISSGGVTDDRGRRTPWPVGLPGLSGVFMYTYIYLYILFFGGQFMVGGSLYMPAVGKNPDYRNLHFFLYICLKINCRGTFLYFSY